jgi:hypothetical protein
VRELVSLSLRPPEELGHLRIARPLRGLDVTLDPHAVATALRRKPGDA